MAALCWMAVIMMTMLLSAGNSSASVDQNQLAGIVNQILERYRPSYEVEDRRGRRTKRFPMFSLAASIPYNSEAQMYDINLVPDTGEQVREKILQCDVYTGERVVAATVLRWPNVLDQCPNERVQWTQVLRKCPSEVKTWADVQGQDQNSECRKAVYDGKADHAEYRTLQKFSNLLNNPKIEKGTDLLLFYVLASPCDKRCTKENGPLSILDKITQIKEWKNYALVFSNVFKPKNGPEIPEEDLRGSLERLGTRVGLSNIFRCSREDRVQCTSCSSNAAVTHYCYSDEAKPGPSSNLMSTIFMQPQQGRSGSSLRNSQGESKEGSNINNDSKTGGGQGESSSGQNGGTSRGKGKKRRVRKRKKANANKDEGVLNAAGGDQEVDTPDDEGVSSSLNGLEVTSANVDSNTAGGDQGGGGSVLDNGRGGAKSRIRPVKRKKKANADNGGGVSSSSNGPKVSNINADGNTAGGRGRNGRKHLPAKKVGGRRIVTKPRRGGNKPVRKQELRKKGGAKSGKRKTPEPTQTRGQMRRRNQLQRKRKKQRRG